MLCEGEATDQTLPKLIVQFIPPTCDLCMWMMVLRSGRVRVFSRSEFCKLQRIRRCLTVTGKGSTSLLQSETSTTLLSFCSIWLNPLSRTVPSTKCHLLQKAKCRNRTNPRSFVLNRLSVPFTQSLNSTNRLSCSQSRLACKSLPHGGRHKQYPYFSRLGFCGPLSV